MAISYVVDTDGVTGDYSSLGEAILAIPYVLDDDYIIICQASTGVADTTAISRNVDTTATSFSVTLIPATGHKASKKWDDTKYRLSLVDETALQIGQHNLTIDGLQIEVVYSASTYKYAVELQSACNDNFTLKNCYLRTTGDSTYRAFQSFGRSPNIKIYNNIIETDGIGLYLNANTGATLEIYNNTIYGNNVVQGIYSYDNSFVIKNNAIWNFTDDIYHGGTGTDIIDYNATDDLDGTNPVSPKNSDWNEEFFDISAEGFTLRNTGNLILGGVGPSVDSSVPTTDIEWDSRSGATTSIGADEYPIEVVRYIDRDATGAGTGLNWTDAYTSMDLWNTAESVDLLATGNRHHVYVRASNNTIDTVNVKLDLWNSDITHELIIDCESSYRLEGDYQWNPMIYILNDYITIKGLNSKNISTASGGARILRLAGDNIKIINSNLYGALNEGIYDEGTNNLIVNSIVQNCNDYGVYKRTSGGSLYVENCLVVNNGTGVYGGGYRTVFFKNSYSGNNTLDLELELNGSIDITTSFTSDGSLSTTIVEYSTTAGAYFKDLTVGSEDFHLQSSSAFIDVGTDLSLDTVYPFDYDKDSILRDSLWDVGPYEYVTESINIILEGDINSISITSSHLNSMLSFTSEINVTSAISSYLNNIFSLVSETNTISTFLGSLNRTFLFTSEVNSIGFVSGSLNNVLSLISGITPVSSTIGSLNNIFSFTSSINSISTSSGFLNQIFSLISEINSISIFSGSLNKVIPITSEIYSIGSISGSLNNVLSLISEINSISDLSSELNNILALTGISTSINDINANIDIIKQLLSSIDNISSLVAYLITQGELSFKEILTQNSIITLELSLVSMVSSELPLVSKIILELFLESKI